MICVNLYLKHSVEYTNQHARARELSGAHLLISVLQTLRWVMRSAVLSVTPLLPCNLDSLSHLKLFNFQLKTKLPDTNVRLLIQCYIARTFHTMQIWTNVCWTVTLSLQIGKEEVIKYLIKLNLYFSVFFFSFLDSGLQALAWHIQIVY